MPPTAKKSPAAPDAGHHLARLQTDSFKSLRDVSIDLGQINVFIGANGSGKSNLLEAIGLLGAAAAGRIDDQALLRRGVRPGMPALYKSSFKGFTPPPKISLAAQASTGASYRIYVTNPIRAPMPFWIFGNEAVSDMDGHSVASRGPRGRCRSLWTTSTRRSIRVRHARSRVSSWTRRWRTADRYF